MTQALLASRFELEPAARVFAFLIMAGGLAAITILTGVGVFLVAIHSRLARL